MSLEHLLLKFAMSPRLSRFYGLIRFRPNAVGCMEQANFASMLEHVDNGNLNSSRHPFVIYSKNAQMTTDCKIAQLLVDLKAITTWDIVVF